MNASFCLFVHDDKIPIFYSALTLHKTQQLIAKEFTYHIRTNILQFVMLSITPSMTQRFGFVNHQKQQKLRLSSVNTLTAVYFIYRVKYLNSTT